VAVRFHHRRLFLGVFDGLEKLVFVHRAAIGDFKRGSALAQLGDGHLIKAFSALFSH
jgi:hypothetical protein